MKTVTIKRKIALETLCIGGSFAGKNKVIPILDCVKCKFTPNGAFVVSSHDGQNAIVKRADCANCNDDSAFCVNYSDFSKALKSLSSDDVTLEIGDKLLTIVHRKGRIEMPISSIEEFPNVDLGGVIYEYEMPSLKLKEWVTIAKNFVSTDNIRPTMCGMYLYIKEEEVGVCATNGHKLYTDSFIQEGTNGCDISAIIPSSCLSPIISVIGGSDNVKTLFYERNVAFVGRDTKIICLLQEGRYPRFKSVIPQSHTINVECEVEELYDGVSRVCSVSGVPTNLVKLDISGTQMLLESENIDFSRKASEECMCANSGNDIVLGVSGENICACLSAVESDRVTLQMTDPTHAVVLRDHNNARKTLLFMPLMLS